MKYLSIINKKFHIKDKKSLSIISMFISIIFVIISFISFVILENVKLQATNTYNESNGKVDLIVNLTNDDYDKLKNIFEDDRLLVVGCLKESNLKINDNHVIIYETNLNLLNEYYSFSDREFNENDIVVNNLLSDKLEDNNLLFNDVNYNIAEKTTKFNFFSENSLIMIINNNNLNYIDNNHSSLILFQNYNHDQDKVTKALKVLETNNITYVNCYENYQTTMIEYEDTKGLIDILVVFSLIIVFILSLTLFMLKFRKEIPFWQTLRMLGYSSKQMVLTILLENTIIVIIGFIIGVILSIPVSMFICIINDIDIRVIIPNFSDILLIFILNYIFNILPTIFIVGKNSKTIIIHTLTKKGSSNNKPMIISAIIGFVCLLVGIIGKVIYGDNFSIGVVFLLILAIMLLTTPLISVIFKVFKKFKNKHLKICGILAGVNFNAVRLISLSVMLCIIAVITISDFTLASERWARTLAEEQLNFDLRINAVNNTIGNEELNLLKNSNNYENKGEYYLTIGQINNISTYIISEISDNKLNNMYGTDISFSGLQDDEIVISSLLANKLNINIGSSLTIVSNNISKTCTVVSIIETYDYNASCVFVANDCFDLTNYYQVVLNVQLQDGENIDDFINQNKYSNIFFSKVDNLKETWKDNIVNGIDIVLAIVIIILIGLLILLYCVIRSYLDNRIRDFTLLHIIGLEQKSTKKILLIEWIIILITIIGVISIGCPFISKNFFIFATHASGFYITYSFSVGTYLLILFLSFIVMFLLPLNCFNLVKNKQSIDKLKSL